VKNGIEIALIWLDQDVLEFLFTCSNGRFSGQAEIYSLSQQKILAISSSALLIWTMQTVEFDCTSDVRIQ
jgi:hypothetical protein